MKFMTIWGTKMSEFMTICAYDVMFEKLALLNVTFILD